jgi:hypothetical protein
MFDNFTNLQEFKKLINIPLAVIIASSIIIFVTTNMNDTNGLSALLGGYSGLLLGLLFVILLNLIFTKNTYFDMFPIVMIMIIVTLLIIYLSTYFDKISKDEVSSYYSSFSLLSTIFLAAQIIMIFSSIYGQNPSENTALFTNTTFSLLGLLSVINIIIVFTIGIVLHFYSTQG